MGHNATLSVPEDLAAQDIPILWIAFLLQNGIRLTSSQAGRWDRHIAKALRFQIPSILTICLAPGINLEKEDLFRIRFDRITLLSRRGSRLSFVAEVDNMEFVSKKSCSWNFTLWLASPAQASAVAAKLARKTYRHVVTGLDGLKAILAASPERWESVGLTSSLIETLAQAQHVQLRCTFRVAAKRFSYRASATAP